MGLYHTLHARIQNVLSEWVQLNSENDFLVDKRERGVQIPLNAGAIICPLAKRHLNSVSLAGQ